MKKQLISKITLIVWILIFIFKEVMEMLHRTSLPYSDLVNTAFRVMMISLMLACAMILIAISITSYLSQNISVKKLTSAVWIIVLCFASVLITNYFYKKGIVNFQLTSIYKIGYLFTLNSVVCFMYLFKWYFFDSALEERGENAVN